MQQDRARARMDFARQVLGKADLASEVACADASFRSYWRVREVARTWIIMDAPPGEEDVRPWLDISARLRNAGLHAPEVFGADIAQGFVLMEDLGIRIYLPELNTASVDALYADALDALFRMQQQIDAADLPHFDTPRVIAEMELMPEWFLQRHLGLAADCGEWDVIENAFRALAQCAAEQPRCFMHRDYHSRNLLVVEPGKPPPDSWLPGPGIIDFQGAMLGPIAYDLASLLRDCYIAWPIERVDAWVEAYRQRLAAVGRVHVDGAHFRRWFDLIGLQRHIKVLGLFCRLWYRDGKAGYLEDLRLVLDYVLSVARLYPEFVDFSQLLQDAVGSGDVTHPRAAA
jgi:N-acetylmuramate 1-kinase